MPTVPVLGGARPLDRGIAAVTPSPLRTWRRARAGLAGWCCLALLFASCAGSATSDGDCPSYLVVPDAGVHGFSAVGEWRTDAVCRQYCQADHPVCQLATATTIKCQKGCG